MDKKSTNNLISILDKLTSLLVKIISNLLGFNNSFKMLTLHSSLGLTGKYLMCSRVMSEKLNTFVSLHMFWMLRPKSDLQSKAWIKAIC